MPRRKKTAAPAARKIDLGLLPSLLGYQLRLAQIAIFRDFNAAVGPQGISPGLFGVLVIIEANPGMKQTELARATHLDRSTVVSVIDNLERRGLVVRSTETVDRRSNALHLTAEGTSLLRQLKRRVAQHEKRLMRHLDADERATLVGLLQKILPEHR
ncbi:MAG: MarR family winged helix-turn-helix transcriptional regulator [Rhodocyclaceae bacterium]